MVEPMLPESNGGLTMHSYTHLRMLAASAALALAISLTGRPAYASGEQLFNTTCVACHTIGGGKRVGPDLKGVTERRSEAWLVKFVKSPQTMIGANDPVALQIFEEHGKILMPDPPYSEAEIAEILGYIKTASATAPAAAARSAPEEAPASPADIELGSRLFQGLTRFRNGGPACNSCHHVTNDAVIGGGVLAKDLTQVFTRVGAPGMSAIIGKPPFPVMEAAYKERPLTEVETRAMVGFLQDVDKQHAMQTPVDYGHRLVLGGTSMFLVLAGVYGFTWRRRKVLPVNHAIFERQVKSV